MQLLHANGNGIKPAAGGRCEDVSPQHECSYMRSSQTYKTSLKEMTDNVIKVWASFIIIFFFFFPFFFFLTRQPQKPAWLSAPWASLTGAVVQQTGDVFEVYVSDRRETLGDVIANHRHLSHFSLRRCSPPAASSAVLVLGGWSLGARNGDGLTAEVWVILQKTSSLSTLRLHCDTDSSSNQL